MLSGAPAAIGLLAFLIGAAGASVPSTWYDEAATLAVAQRSPEAILRTIGASDAVHGLYYLAMHEWIALFGASELSVRLPSAIACGVTAAGVVVLGRQLADLRVGIYAGVVCAILPRMTWAAVEARSFAITAAIAVWMTVVWWCAARARRSGRRSAGWWVGYAVFVAAGGVLFVYSLLLPVAHLLALLLLPRLRVALPAFLTAVGVAGVPISPAVLVFVRQSGQVSWIPAPGARWLRTLVEYQYFPAAPVIAVVAVAGVVAALVVRRPRGDAAELPVVAGLWVLIPTATLVVVSLAVRPVYLDRYLTFTAPAVALLVGWAVAGLGRRTAVVAVTLAVAVAALIPTYLGQRTAAAKPSAMDFSEVTAYAAAHVQPGDCALYDTVPWLPTSLRVIAEARPDVFGDLADPDPAISAAEHGWLWDHGASARIGVAAINYCTRVWLFTDADRDSPLIIEHTSGEIWEFPANHASENPLVRAIIEAGFHQIDERQFRRTAVFEFER